MNAGSMPRRDGPREARKEANGTSWASKRSNSCSKRRRSPRSGRSLSVNRADLLQRRGLYPPPPGPHGFWGSILPGS